MAEPPPIDEDVLGDGDVSFLDGRSSGAFQTESAVLSRLEQQTQEIKSLKTALLEQKELYRSALGELATEKEKNKAFSASLEELKTARGADFPPVEQTAWVAPKNNSTPLSADAAEETTARLNERVRAYELEIRSLRDDVKAWEEAVALNETKIQQLQTDLASAADGKESAMRVLQEATRHVKQLEEKLARRDKESPKADKIEQSRSVPNSKRKCSYSMGQVADLAAEADALRMNLDVAQRNLRETERLREIDAGTIEQLRTECDRLTALVAAKMDGQETTKPSVFVGMEGAEQSSSSHQQATPQHSTITPYVSGGEDKNAAVTLTTKPSAFVGMEGAEQSSSFHQQATPQHSTPCVSGGEDNAAVAAPLEVENSNTALEGRTTPSQECQACVKEAQMEEISDPSGAQATSECNAIEGSSPAAKVESRQVEEVGTVQELTDGHEKLLDESILIS